MALSDAGDPIRVVLAKPGLDGHDRGVRIIARALREEGMQVVYTGIRQTPDMIVEAARRERADAVGLSSLSGAHMELFPAVVEGLAEAGMNDVVVVAGGIIPEEDRSALGELGVAAVFGPGATLEEISRAVRREVEQRRQRQSPPPAVGRGG